MATLQAQVLGLSLEDRGDGLSDLTIDLQTVVSAQALAALLASLATLYRIGYSVAQDRESNWITFGNDLRDPLELYITRLEIGTPNKVRVTGLSSVLHDIHKILEILTLATALMFPSTASQHQNIEQTTIVEGQHPEPPVLKPAYSPLEFQQAINANIEMRINLDREHAEGRITLQDYIERQAMLDRAYRELLDGIKVTSLRPEAPQ